MDHLQSKEEKIHKPFDWIVKLRSPFFWLRSFFFLLRRVVESKKKKEKMTFERSRLGYCKQGLLSTDNKVVEGFLLEVISGVVKVHRDLLTDLPCVYTFFL